MAETTPITFPSCAGEVTMLIRIQDTNDGVDETKTAHPLDLEHAGYIPADVLDRFLAQVITDDEGGCNGSPADECGECIACRASALQDAICEHRVHELMALWKYHAQVVTVLKENDSYEDGCHPERLRAHLEAGMTPEQAAAEEIEPGPDKSDWVKAIAATGRACGL